jgi:hypothetical protein
LIRSPKSRTSNMLRYNNGSRAKTVCTFI